MLIPTAAVEMFRYLLKVTVEPKNRLKPRCPIILKIGLCIASKPNRIRS